jgi:hypothetical protein
MANPSPLISHLYTADPSAHVFNGKLYIYPSHDRETDIEDNDNGDQYDMIDYHVFSVDSIKGPAKDHGVALKAEDVPWVGKQLWAPDATEKDGKYYLYFPARDKEDVFRIGVAVGDKPEGPFKPDLEPIPGSYSIDPACFVDDDRQAYLYFGGIWGGQLQCWRSRRFDREAYASMEANCDEPALFPRVAKMNDGAPALSEIPTSQLLADSDMLDMRSFHGQVQELVINDTDGKPIHSSKHDRRFFEAGKINLSKVALTCAK